MLTKEFLLKLFDAFSILRWNDLIRPIEFIEMDKHAHKMIIAYVLGKYEEQNGNKVNWIKIINGGIFELMRRIILSDIKSPVYHQIKDNHPEIIRKLNKQVYNRYDKIIPNARFKAEFREYMNAHDYLDDLSKNILKAAQIYSSFWEFQIIKPSNPFEFDINEIEISLSRNVGNFEKQLTGIKKIISREKIAIFVDICGQLRFQTRWAQVQRIPKTSVLGHMLLVAILTYLFSYEANHCQKRKYNNFFGGLFHDLPEAVTRDISSPVKYMVTGMDRAIKEVEEELVDKKIFSNFEPEWKEELEYFIKDEFANKVKINNKIKIITSASGLSKKFNKDSFDPLDGNLIQASDKLSAFLEVYTVNKLGLSPTQMQNVMKNIKNEYVDKKISDINFKKIYQDF